MAEQAQREAGSGLLARWYAAPLAAEHAQQLLERMEQRQRRYTVRAKRHFCLRLLQLYVHFQRATANGSEDIGAGQYRHLLAITPRSPHARALLELLWGQLLLSRKIQGAWQHLDEGFRLATHIFHNADYFVVMKRHQQLRHIPLQAKPAARAHSLDELLRLAGVIEQLQKPQIIPPGKGRDPDDTFG